MLLGGLWHGANWTFVGWGALHGFFLWVEKMLQDMRTNSLKSKIIQDDKPEVVVNGFMVPRFLKNVQSSNFLLAFIQIYLKT